MPRINRIRIINFSYNNDSRHIQDETFNFHGGENALLSLANGGGKVSWFSYSFSLSFRKSKFRDGGSMPFFARNDCRLMS